MKDDNNTILLEGLAEDVSAIQKMMNHLVLKLEKPPDSNIVAEHMKIIKSGLDALKQDVKNINNAPELVEQQRVIDLRLQLDRISVRLNREDKLLFYYFSSPKIVLATIAIVIGAIFIGAFADRAYYRHQQTKIENYGERSF